MKKRLISVIAAVTCMLMLFATGCTPVQPGEEPPAKQPAIQLRSDATQALKVGEKLNLAYSVHNTKSAVIFTSSNTDVVTVDKFASVTAVGAGQATVTLKLEDDETVKTEVKFTVTKNNFMITNGYFNGNILFGDQDKGGPVTIRDGQAQLLANAAGQKWYFKTRIDRTGYVNDPGGHWGVGSFLVNAANPIGDIMFWYAMQSAGGSDSQVRARYGGYRYAADVSFEKFAFINDEVYDITESVNFTIIRDGIMHYLIAEFGKDDSYKLLKYSYEVPLFDGVDTFPGVFGQNQKLTVSNYSMSNDPSEVDKVLESFQLAEGVEFNGVGDTLYTGDYVLTATVTPAYTINKRVTYRLEAPVAGVTLQDSGALTIDNSVAEGTKFTVVATAVSNTEITKKKTFTVAKKAASSSALFDTGAIVIDNGAPYYPAETTDAIWTPRQNSEYAYIPLCVNADKWFVTATVQNRTSDTTIVGTEIGIMSALNGYFDYAKLGIDYDKNVDCNASFGELDGKPTVFENAAKGGATAEAENTLGLIKDGDTYYVIINGRFTKKITAKTAVGKTTPTLYAFGTGAKFTNVSVVTDAAAIDEYVAAHPYYIGSCVTVAADNTYVLSDSVDFGLPGNKNDTLDWPPDNDYANGIKSAAAFDGDYSIEFVLSDVKPQVISGVIDAKILIYLKSERTTCSLQFEIKRAKTGDPTTVRFVPNLDDATWNGYAIPQGVDILNGETTVKVVRRAACVELYLNGTRVYEGEQYMANTGFWDNSTLATPGIGTFFCGATIKDPVFKAEK